MLFVTGCATAHGPAPITAPEYRGHLFIQMVRELTDAIGWDPATVRMGEINMRDGKPNQEINALSMGNRRFYATYGFMVAALSDRCLGMGVLAHEFAHEVLGHTASRQSAANATMVLGAIAGGFIPGTGDLVAAAAFPILRAYDRHQELEADRLAVAILHKAGRPPGAMRWALTRLKITYGEKGGGWLDTHPALSERIEALPELPGYGRQPWREVMKQC